MAKCVLIILFQMSFSIIQSFGQNNGLSHLYLTNYTFSDDRTDIGYLG
jgi:hypothetical protein